MARFGHLVLRTNRLAAMRDWYATVLDCRVVASSPQMVFLTYDDEHHRIALVDDGPLERTPRSSPLAHVAFAVDSVDALGATRARLEAIGILPQRATDHRITLSLYYDDPDGNSLELFADTPYSKKSAQKPP
jgi:catechol-2,3-dioxygenase